MPDEFGAVDLPAPAGGEDFGAVDLPDAPAVDPDKRLATAFNAGLRDAPDRRAGVLRLAREARMPTDVVEANYEGFKQTWEASQFDPKAWREKNPDLAKLADQRPELAGLVVKDQQLSAVSQLLNKSLDAKQWLAAKTGIDIDEHPALKLLAPGGVVEAPGQAFDAAKELITGDAPPNGDQVRAQQRRQPTQGTVLDDEQAKEVRDTNAVARPFVLGYHRLRETLQQMELSQLQFQLMTDRAVGRDTYDLEKRIIDLQRTATPRDYGEGASEQVITDIAQAVGSEVPVLANATGGAVAGGVTGGVVGGIATRNPAGIRAGALQGAKIGGRAGLALGSFKLEAGQEYGDLLQAKTDAGVPLTEGEARGGAIIYGAAATAVEMWSTEQLLKSFGPLGTALRTGSGKAAVAELLTKDATFRQLATRIGQAWGKEATSEGTEEFVQQVLQDATTYFAKSHRAGALEPATGADLERHVGEALTAGEKGLIGGLGLGAAGSSVHLTTQMIAMDRAAAAGQQVAALTKLADSPTLKAAPDAVANLVADATLNKGEAVTHLYVDAPAFQRLFQSENGDPGAAAEQLLGPDGRRQLQQALATGIKLEVPVADYLERWGGTGAAERLAEDTTTSPTLATTRELAAMRDQVEKQTAALVEQFQKDEGPPALPAERQALDRYAQQLAATGLYTDKQTSNLATVNRAALHTLAARSGLSVSQLARDFEVQIRQGDEAPATALQQSPVGPTAAEVLSQRADELSSEQRAHEYYVDPVSGLRNRRAFDVAPAPKGMQVAVITSPDVKPINDHPTAGGHEVANGLLRAIGRAVGQSHPEAARSGTSFLLYVKDRAELDQVLERVRQSAGENVAVKGAVATSKKAAFDTLDKSIETARAFGRIAPRGQPSAGLDVASLKYSDELFPGAAPAEGLAEIGGVQGQKYFEQVYQTPEGMLTAEGWNAIPRKKHVGALDMRGLKSANQTYGTEAGDRLLGHFRALVVALGGADFDAAHLSGDEFAVQSDDLEQLKGFLGDLHAAVKDLKIVERTLATGAVQRVDVGFRHGFGATYGEADRDLNAGRRAEEAAPGAGEKRRVDLGRREGPQPGQQRSGPQAYVAAAERRLLPRLEQPDGGGGAPRGYVEFARQGLKRVFRIALNQSADVSTLLHESAHVYLEMFGDLAERPEVGAGFKQLYQRTLQYLGADSRASVTTEQHEKFARAFERYMFEGKAPSADLLPVFERFRLWLTRVYRSIRGLNVELNDDIRDVFDRMLATDDELEELRRRAGLDPLFKTPAEAGMAPEQWEAYLRAQERAVSNATRGAELRLLKERDREQEAWWKDELSKETDQAQEDYEKLPARVAQQALKGKHPAFAFPVALDRDAVVTAIGKEKAQQFQLRSEGGETPDSMAQVLGFPTGEAMLKAIVALPEKDAWVRQTADQQMSAKHPSLLEDRAKLRQEIATAMHSDETATWLHRELVALERKAKLPSSPSYAEAAKAAARQIVATRRVGQLNASAALQAERSSARRTVELAAKGDFAAAVAAKKQQLLNMYLYRELLDARKERDRFETLVAQLKKPSSRARLGKASVIYRDGVGLLLESFQLQEPQPREGGYPSVREIVAELDSDAATVAFDETDLSKMLATRGLADWKALTVDRLRTLDTALRNIQAAAQARTSVLLDEKRADKDLVVADLVAEAKKNLRSRGPLASSVGAAELSERAAEGWNRFTGYLLEPEKLIRELAGGDLNSTWFKAVVLPMQRGKHREADLLREVIKPIFDTFEKLPAEARKHLSDAIDGAKLFPTHRVAGDLQLKAPTRRFELLVMALNTGNDSNFQRLTDGRGITREQVVAARELLTDEELTWAQSVWDALEALRPLAFDLEEQDSGVRPEPIKATGFTVRGKTYRGGYFPAVYDNRADVAGERQQIQQLADLQDPNYTRAGTAQGHLKGRADEYSGVIKLDPNEITRHLVQVAHDIAFRQAVKSVGSLLLDSDVQGVLKDRLGVARTRYLLQWVKDVGTMRGVDVASPMVGLMRWLRANTTTSALGFKPLLALEDWTTAIGTAITKGVVKPSYLAAAMTEMARSPLEFLARAQGQSGEVRSRREQFQRELTKQLRELRAPRVLAVRALQFVKDHAFVLQETFDKGSTAIIWSAAHAQALDAGEAPEAAKVRADAAVRDMLPSHSPVDQSAVLRDKTVIGLILQFHGYFNHAANQLYDVLRPFRQEGTAMEKGQAGARALGMLLVMTIVSSLVRGQLPDEKSEEGWVQWFLRKFVGGVLSLSPFGGDLSQGFERQMLGKEPNPRALSVLDVPTRFGQALYQIGDDDKDLDKRVTNLLRSLGPLTGIPFAPATFAIQQTSDQR